MNNNCAM